MIKYLELTAPQTSAFRQATILSIECSEGERVNEGTTLFKVKSGNQELDLPSTQDGRIVEMIATTGQNITLSTALVLLETEVEGSTATPPIVDSRASSPGTKSTKSKTDGAKTTQDEAQVAHNSDQQTLDLSPENFQLTQEIAPHSKQSSAKYKGKNKSQAQLKTTKTKPNNQTSSTITSKNMSSNSSIDVTVPDIGADSAKVIEILVKVGDTVAAEDALITLESDKASMDVPSTHAGVISSIEVSLDQDVSEGAVIVKLDSQTSQDTSPDTAKTDAPAESAKPETATPTNEASSDLNQSPQQHNVTIPDIGGDSAKVIEILVSVGDQVEIEDPLVTLESDKASMDVPSSIAGEISSIEVQLDQDVSEGTVVASVMVIGSAGQANVESSTTAPAETAPAEQAKPVSVSNDGSQSADAKPQSTAPAATGGTSHASPSIRRFARELGVDLSKINGSGRKGRVIKEDVKGFVKGVMSGAVSSSQQASGGAGIPPIPAQDFSKFGEIEVQPLNKIKRLTATNLHRAWLNVPHVTHNDEANISDLESFRKELNAEAAKLSTGVKLSPLAFIVKAVVHGLRHYPQFNSSLDANGENLILKKYFNIGIAVETPNGLVVPVLRDADKKSISEIAKEMGALAAKARDKKLTMADMSGACFTISSLGGIGGTSFTPIVNAPEVAILGVSRSKMAPVWNGQEFEPGMMLPLSLSYDHRVIDGAEAARFTRHVATALEDVRRLTI